MLNLYQLSTWREDREGVTVGYVGLVKTILKAHRSIDRLRLPVSTAVCAGHGGGDGMKRLGQWKGRVRWGGRGRLSPTPLFVLSI